MYPGQNERKGAIAITVISVKAVVDEDFSLSIVREYGLRRQMYNTYIETLPLFTEYSSRFFKFSLTNLLRKGASFFHLQQSFYQGFYGIVVVHKFNCWS